MPPEHKTPHPPQFSGSLGRKAQYCRPASVVQTVVPCEHPPRQMPPAHTSPPMQVTPQPPQLDGSCPKLTHAVPPSPPPALPMGHRLSNGEQAQAAPQPAGMQLLRAQVPPSPQPIPQEPQLRGSLWMSTQMAPPSGATQVVKPTRQRWEGPPSLGVQPLSAQISSLGHICPQPPQLAESFCVSTQTAGPPSAEGHVVSPMRQVTAGLFEQAAAANATSIVTVPSFLIAVAPPRCAAFPSRRHP